MPLPYIISTATNATNAAFVAAESGCVVLYHGACRQNIDSIVTFGIDEEQAKRCGAEGSFWASRHYWDAVNYSQMPPHDRGDPAVLGFQVPEEMLSYFVQQTPPLVREYWMEGWYKFFPQSFPVLTSGMKAITVFQNTTNVES